MHTEKIRIYPNKTQQKIIDEMLWNCKELYNYLMNLNITTYQSTGKGILGNSLDKPSQKFIGNKLPAAVRLTVIRRLTTAFERFFKKLAKFPKYKSINQYRSIIYNHYKHGFNFTTNCIKLTKLGKVRAKFTRVFGGLPKQCIIKKMRSGKYYAFVQIDDEPKKIEINQPEDIVAIDLGISKFFTDNNGNYINAPKFLKRNLKKLARAQRELMRKQKGSKNREKARIKYARIYEKIANIRSDFHFKVAHYLVTTYKEIICENLEIKSMFPGKSRAMKLMRRMYKNIVQNF